MTQRAAGHAANVCRLPWNFFRAAPMAALFLLAACGGETPSSVPHAPQNAPNVANTAQTVDAQTSVPKNAADEKSAPAERETNATASAVSEPREILVKFDIVDLQGKPLPNMAPIASERPNAFDQPIVTGLLSNAQGHTEMRVPAQRHLYLRAWDPGLAYFANNFYDLLPGDGNVANGIVIQMVPGATVEAQLFGADGAPLAEKSVGMMLLHSTQGPWWPAESRTGADGGIHFEHVPAGAFTIKFKTESGETLDVPETYFPPAGAVKLGALHLH